MGYADLSLSGARCQKVITDEDLSEMELGALPGCGACNLLGTANSMNYLGGSRNVSSGSAIPAVSRGESLLPKDGSKNNGALERALRRHK